MAVMPFVRSSHPIANQTASRLRSGWTREPGWLLLPLRAFLGVTFTYAGLQKLANPGYLDPHSPTSVAHQMLLLRRTSPIGFLLGVSAHAPTLVGLLIAFGELAVGLATLFGLYTRIAAAAGALLSLTFFLTVSWNTTPYYYGSDVVFVFAWLVLLAFGSASVLSVDGWLRARARRDLHLAPEPVTVAVDTLRLRALCPRGSTCALTDGQCARRTGCPVFPAQESLAPEPGQDLGRRIMLTSAAAAGLVGSFTVLLGALTAVVGRLAAGTARATPIAARASSPAPRPTAAATPAPDTTRSAKPSTITAADTPAPNTTTDAKPSTITAASHTKPPRAAPAPVAAPPGTAVAAVSAVPVGQALSVTNPADGGPGWVVHTATDTFTAFSAICTHAGCPVQYDPSAVQFLCPCHGGVYDARTGQVLQGPPPSPLPTIAVHVVQGQIRIG